MPWIRSRTPPLSEEEHARLPKALEVAKIDVGNSGPGYYLFVHRVCKEYKVYVQDITITSQVMHEHRDTHVAACISQVFSEIRPVNARPHNGDITDALLSLLPVVESVFLMPESGGHPYGSDQWRAEQGKHPSKITFASAVRFPDLRLKKVKYMIKKARGPHGFPARPDDDQIPGPGETYSFTRNHLRAKGNNQAHKYLVYCRKAAVLALWDYFKKIGLTPIAVDSKNMPSKMSWNNFAECLWTAWFFLCDYDGIPESLETALRLQYYLFFALYDNGKGRMWPVLRCIHRFSTNGRHRFARTAHKCFAKFFQLLNDEPNLIQFVNDQGKGSPPLRYIAAVEEGLREYGKDVHSMGTNALRSPNDWSIVPNWKKREAYIAAIRYKWEYFNYEQWDHFLLRDYVDRQTLTTTFRQRHLKYSNGEAIGHLLPAIQEIEVSPPLRRRGRSNNVMKTEDNKVHTKDMEEPCEVLMFDPLSGEMVQIISSDDE